MSLNNRRRIFRSSFPIRRMLSAPVPNLRVTAVLCSTLACAAAGWVVFVYPDAPKSAQSGERMVADVARVAVVDGNTLRVEDRVVRLDGIVPPERGETCQGRDGLSFDCGVAAANALAAMLRQGTVDCTLVGIDRNGRARAMCSSGGAQLNHAVVAQGWARASDGSLASAEQAARAQQRGLWAMAR